MSLTDNRNKINHIRAIQRLTPYETPINVRAVCNMPYGDNGLLADFYEPMAYRVRAAGDVHPRQVLVILPDEPYLADKNLLAPFAMEMAKRGFSVFVPSLCRGKSCSFYDQVDNLFGFLSQLAVDAFDLGVSIRTPSSDGNTVILVGCGSGALLASIGLGMYGNYALRAHFAPHCPTMATYFGMGATPDVDLSHLPIVGGLVSISGLVHLPYSAYRREYAPWFVDKTGAKLYDYLSLASCVYLEMPPVLLVTSQADEARRQALYIDNYLRDVGLSCRLVDVPATDAEKREAEPLFSVYYPMWPLSVDVNDQIASFCRGAGLPANAD